MAQQTAVEWFYQRILAKDIKEIFEQAKAMEKERAVNFCFECLRGDNIHTIKSNKELLEYIEQYYNETYNK